MGSIPIGTIFSVSIHFDWFETELLTRIDMNVNRPYSPNTGSVVSNTNSVGSRWSYNRPASGLTRNRQNANLNRLHNIYTRKLKALEDSYKTRKSIPMTAKLSRNELAPLKQQAKNMAKKTFGPIHFNEFSKIAGIGGARTRRFRRNRTLTRRRR